MGLMQLFKREPVTRVRMINSVDEFVAGESYDLPVEVADRFVIRGYAKGSLSREYSADERATLHANTQVVMI